MTQMLPPNSRNSSPNAANSVAMRVAEGREREEEDTGRNCLRTEFGEPRTNTQCSLCGQLMRTLVLHLLQQNHLLLQIHDPLLPIRANGRVASVSNETNQRTCDVLSCALTASVASCCILQCQQRSQQSEQKRTIRNEAQNQTKPTAGQVYRSGTYSALCSAAAALLLSSAMLTSQCSCAATAASCA